MTDVGKHKQTLTEMRSLRLELRTVLEHLHEFARGQAPHEEITLAWELPPQRAFKYGRRLIPAFSVRVGSRLSRATTLEVGIVEACTGQRLNGVLKGELTARVVNGVASFPAVILHLLARPSLKRMLALCFVVHAINQDPADTLIRPLVSRTVMIHNRPQMPSRLSSNFYGDAPVVPRPGSMSPKFEKKNSQGVLAAEDESMETLDDDSPLYADVLDHLLQDDSFLEDFAAADAEVGPGDKPVYRNMPSLRTLADDDDASAESTGVYDPAKWHDALSALQLDAGESPVINYSDPAFAHFHDARQFASGAKAAQLVAAIKRGARSCKTFMRPRRAS
ncbi:hypothetical protein T492DRAFT_985342 [Pavlovales sp. CCMP2436]|nr:hypothetical protein T492DRAFT_985342 [Pavlovales sp. CCMP2436]